jgi:hypothetical protein
MRFQIKKKAYQSERYHIDICWGKATKRVSMNGGPRLVGPLGQEDRTQNAEHQDGLETSRVRGPTSGEPLQVIWGYEGGESEIPGPIGEADMADCPLSLRRLSKKETHRRG